MTVTDRQFSKSQNANFENGIMVWQNDGNSHSHGHGHEHGHGHGMFMLEAKEKIQRVKSDRFMEAFCYGFFAIPSLLSSEFK